MERFHEGNRAGRELITIAARHDVNRVRFTNPFLPLLRFRVGAGLLILVRHQDRHLQQAERVRAAMRDIPAQ